MTSVNPQSLFVLREIAQLLNAVTDLDTTLDLISRKTTEVLGVDSCSIYLADPDGARLRLRASTGLSSDAFGRGTLIVGEGLTGTAVSTNAPVNAPDAQDDLRFKFVPDTEEQGFHSLLAIPLTIAMHPIGAMNVQTRERREFGDATVELLSLIGDLASGALAKAQLLDSQRSQLDELQTVARVSEAVTSPQYLDDMLDVVTEVAAHSLDVAVCALYLIDDDKQHLALRSMKKHTLYDQRRRVLMSRSVAGRAVLEKRPIYIPDVRQEENFANRAMAEKQGIISMIAVPLIVRGDVIGALSAYTAKKHKFSNEQISLLTTLANQTALAIENSRLVTNTAIVREMHHRIKNNLQTIAMLMQLQLREADQLSTHDVLRMNIDRVHAIAAVHEALSEEGFRLVNVNDVLKRIIRSTMMITHPQMQVGIHVEGETLSLPSQSATSLILVVNELIQNALEHGFAGREHGMITISIGHAPDNIAVLVRDNGVGLPDDFEENLGLNLAQTLITEDLRGELTFNRLANGTEASIRLPKAIKEIVNNQ